LRQFIYSNDLGRLMPWYLLEWGKTDQLILAADSENEISIADAARLVADAVGFKGQIVFERTKADGQFQKTCSNARLRSIRPSFEFTPIRQAVTEAVAWFVEKYETCRK
jgi:GDP-L-fucose synthase